MWNGDDLIIICNKIEDFNKHFFMKYIWTNNLIKFDYIVFNNYYLTSISLLTYCGNELSLCLFNNDANTEEDIEKYIVISQKNLKLRKIKIIY